MLWSCRWAAFLDDDALTELLLSMLMDTEDSEWYYGTALKAATSLRPHSIIQLSLDAGADVNMLPCRRQTVLQAAILSGKAEVVVILLEHRRMTQRLCIHGRLKAPEPALQTGKVSSTETVLENGQARCIATLTRYIH